jgi:hypothetical protein
MTVNTELSDKAGQDRSKKPNVGELFEPRMIRDGVIDDAKGSIAEHT